MATARHLDRRLRMQHLRLLEALDRTGSLSGASRLLGLSQPAATKSLQDAEEVVGSRLFERHPQGVTPTIAGRMTIRYARQMLVDLGKLDEDLDRLESGGGLLAIGGFPVAAAGLLHPIVERLAVAHPDLEIRVEEGRVESLLPRLVSGELVVVVGRLYEPELPDGLVREALYDEPISLVARAGHPVFQQPAFELAKATLLLPTFSQRIGREIEHYLARLAFDLPVRKIRSASHMFIREMLNESDMLAVTPQLLVAGDLRRGLLRTLPELTPGPVRAAGLILNPARPLAAPIQAAVETMRSAIRARAAFSGSGIRSLG